MGKRLTLSQTGLLRACLAALEEFQISSGTMRGETATTRPVLGDLPESFRSQIAADQPDYIVYSYRTPIAWHAADGSWHIPDVIYSLTTTQHQYTVKAALPAYETDGPHVSLRSGRGPRGRYGPRGGDNGDGMTGSRISSANQAEPLGWEITTAMHWWPVGTIVSAHP